MCLRIHAGIEKIPVANPLTTNLQYSENLHSPYNSSKKEQNIIPGNYEKPVM